jgi:allatostatin receptor
LANGVMESTTPNNMAADTTEMKSLAGAAVDIPIAEGPRVLVLVLGWLAWVSGIFGNVLILVTLVSQPSLRCHIYNIFIGNLAVADLLVVSYSMLSWLLNMSLGYYPMVDLLHCRINGCFNSMCVLASIFTMVLISFNRYLSVVRPLAYERFFSRAKTVALCAGVWVSCFLLSLIPLLRLGNSNYIYSATARICSFDGRDPFNLFNIICVFSLTAPSVIIGVFSLAIYRSWRASRLRVDQWSSGRQGNSNGNTSHAPGKAPANAVSSSNMAVVRSLVLVFVLLVVLYLPLAIGLSMNNVISAGTYAFLVLLLFLNHCINWLVYGALNANFRNGYRRLMLGRCAASPASQATADDCTVNTVS